jgi:tRNA pseudouridine32 synthase/23S rRNA pseudouridine746 synthase
VHLAAIGHPILGDTLYAPAPWAGAAARLLLHASALALPAGGEAPALECHSAVPF